MDVRNELQYILVVRLLEKAAAAGLLTAEELHYTKRLAIEKYHPQTVRE